MKTTLSFNQIKEALPHSYPFVLLDKVLEIMPGEKVVALKNISGNEWMVPGHFPGRAIFPGVLLIEALAQSSLFLFNNEAQDNIYLIAGVKSRFLGIVEPGDQVIFTVEADKIISTGGILSGVATVNDVPVMKATITVAIRQNADL